MRPAREWTAAPGVPALVIHGTDDEAIPYRLGRRLFDALPGKKTFVTIDKGMHNNLDVVDPHRLWSSINDFINRRE
jgi:fermentation-respiration switch protein FrsA (DUF1100 family)